MSGNTSSGGSARPTWLNKIAKQKTTLLQKIFEMEPIHVDVKHPITKKLRDRCQGEDILRAWEECYADDPIVKNIVIDTATGPSTPDKDYYDDINANPAMPYQQLRALVGDGGKWKWPEIWKNLDLLPRRGPAWRSINDPSNLGSIENPNPNIVPLNCLVVGGGPVGIRLAIELVLGGHRVTIFEKRREERDDSGKLLKAGFTNRVNRPHIKNFCRNDLDRLNGRNFMTPKMCYPVFTNAHTSSIGIDEAQMMLLKTALLLGVRFELGVGYVDAEVEIDDESPNQRPFWEVEYTADEIACQKYGKTASGGKQRFDALFGCDGGGSKVRGSQVDWLGVPKTRKYKKMYGIVSNLRKCSRSKLKSLGFDSGLEPEDRAGNLTGVFFYKASHHNYLIVHPSAEEMEKNDIPWKGIFGFDKARSSAVGASDTTAKLKETLKKYMTKKAKELNIPIDDTLPNGGFVDAPNDVMGFDFSEFYNCERSAACSVPPLDWDCDRDGDWEVNCPLVALAGDAVADPNWLLGVGLQRGWNSALDACFYADNVYNNKSFNGKPPSIDEPINSPIEWESHLDNLSNLMTKLSNNSRESKLSAEMNAGMLDQKGPVVLQIQKLLAARDCDAPVPQYLPVVEPWYRYQEFEIAVNKNYKGQNLMQNIHPTATRELAIFKKNNVYVDKGAYLRNTVTRPTGAMLTWAKRFECSAFWCDMSMKLLVIDGKAAPGEKPIENKITADEEAKIEMMVKVERPKMDSDEVKTVARRRRESLRSSIVEAAMSPRSLGVSQHDRSGIDLLIAKAAGKGKSRFGGLPEGPPLGDDKPSPVSESPFKKTPFRKSPFKKSPFAATPKAAETPVAASTPTAGLDQGSLSIIQELTKALDGGSANSGAKDALLELRRRTISYEKEMIKARLDVAQAQVAQADAEEAVIRAKKACARKEVEALSNLLSAYKDAESKDWQMVP